LEIVTIENETATAKIVLNVLNIKSPVFVVIIIVFIIFLIGTKWRKKVK
jgi:hypothetical protein